MTFEPNGGTCGTASDTYEVGLTYGTLPAPVRTGWRFIGWFDAADGGTKVTVNLEVTAAATRTLYAHWEANQYKVGLKRINGSGGTTEVTATFGSPMPAIDELPWWNGHTFDGYWSERDGGGTQYYRGDGSSVRTWDIAATTNLYGSWKANQYTLTLDRQEGTGGSATVTATYGAALPAITPPTRTGHTFGGYYASPNGNGAQYYHADGTCVQWWYNTTDMTLYAFWTKVLYYVTLDKQNGSGGTSSVGAYYNGALPSITPPTRTGYTFGGYFTAANGGGTQYYSAAGDPLLNWTQASNGKLYAKWTSNGGGDPNPPNPDPPSPDPPAPNPPAVTTYTVNFNANGGTGAMAAQAIAAGATAALRANAFTRSSYVFIGWSTTATGPVAYADGASVKNLAAAGGSVTLYAKWAKKTYKVKFIANGGKLPPGKKMAVQKMTYGKAKRLTANKFKRDGFVFKGWAKSKKLAKKGKVAYKNKKKVKNLVTTGKTVKLYAVWKKK